ncbi:WGR domain-containing protein [Roseovarius sp. D22-M7]|uniref:WGR domain-containing protein n=1 Tax=Roseovarius sp. D22-M7 TaxID=3127116 RepID=UPI00300FB80D
MSDFSPLCPIQMEVFPDQMHLRREDPTKNMRRFYKMVVQRDLFGGASLIREWGRLGSPGKLRVDHHLDEGHAVNALINLMTAKRRRGYE